MRHQKFRGVSLRLRSNDGPELVGQEGVARLVRIAGVERLDGVVHRDERALRPERREVVGIAGPGGEELHDEHLVWRGPEHAQGGPIEGRSQWAEGIERWRSEVQSITGNPVEVLEVAEDEIASRLTSKRPLWRDIRRDGRVVHGVGIDEWLGARIGWIGEDAIRDRLTGAGLCAQSQRVCAIRSGELEAGA